MYLDAFLFQSHSISVGLAFMLSLKPDSLILVKRFKYLMCKEVVCMPFALIMISRCIDRITVELCVMVNCSLPILLTLSAQIWLYSFLMGGEVSCFPDLHGRMWRFCVWTNDETLIWARFKMLGKNLNQVNMGLNDQLKIMIMNFHTSVFLNEV